MLDTSDFDTFIEQVKEILGEGNYGEYNRSDILLDYFDENPRVEVMQQEGGGEGGAENCFTVLHVDDDYYKVFYNYYSHEGFCFDYAEVHLVSPKEKTITVYE